MHFFSFSFLSFLCVLVLFSFFVFLFCFLVLFLFLFVFVFAFAGNVVVYGDRLEAYCAMTMLLDNSVSAKRLTLVLPPPSADVGSPRKCFADTVVAEAMAKSLKDLGNDVMM